MNNDHYTSAKLSIRGFYFYYLNSLYKESYNYFLTALLLFPVFHYHFETFLKVNIILFAMYPDLVNYQLHL